MADLLKAAKDPKFREDVIRGLGETFSRGVAGVLGAPVDLTTMAMRPFGYNVPAEQVVGGSEYIGRQMEEAGLISSARRPAAEFLANVVTPDPMDVAKLAAMAVPVVGRAMREAPRDEAMRIAQANAAKPVSEGGLGLPPDNTAMDRARAMGFDTPAYRGTTADETNLKPRTFVSENPDVSNQYAGYLKDFADNPVMLDAMMKLTPNGNVMPLLVRNADVARSRTNVPDYEMIVDANQARSRFAAFDPARRYESDLLGAADPRLLAGVAGATGAGLYGAGRMQEGEERPQPRFGYRPDGTPKGEGWLGVLPMADGNVATEYSMQSQAVKVGDKMVDFPTLVPTLSSEEVNLMLSDIIPNRKPIPEPIVQKAIKHAKGRLDKGLSPFKELGE